MSVLHVLPLSVLDVWIHKVGARVAKVRLAKLKESENDALVSVYSYYFFDIRHGVFLFDTGHLQS